MIHSHVPWFILSTWGGKLQTLLKNMTNFADTKTLSLCLFWFPYWESGVGVYNFGNSVLLLCYDVGGTCKRYWYNFNQLCRTGGRLLSFALYTQWLWRRLPPDEVKMDKIGSAKLLSTRNAIFLRADFTRFNFLSPLCIFHEVAKIFIIGFALHSLKSWEFNGTSALYDWPKTPRFIILDSVVSKGKFSIVFPSQSFLTRVIIEGSNKANIPCVRDPSMCRTNSRKMKVSDGLLSKNKRCILVNVFFLFFFFSFFLFFFFVKHRKTLSWISLHLFLYPLGRKTIVQSKWKVGKKYSVPYD